MGNLPIVGVVILTKVCCEEEGYEEVSCNREVTRVWLTIDEAIPGRNRCSPRSFNCTTNNNQFLDPNNLDETVEDTYLSTYEGILNGPSAHAQGGQHTLESVHVWMCEKGGEEATRNVRKPIIRVWWKPRANDGRERTGTRIPRALQILTLSSDENSTRLPHAISVSPPPQTGNLHPHIRYSSDIRH